MNSRHFATLKDIQLRLKSVKSIEKITKSMKMIAATKLNRAQKAMETGRVFGENATASLPYLMPTSGFSADSTQTSIADHSKKESLSKEHDIPNNTTELLIVCSSDRGLCGAIHSSVSKKAKEIITQKQQNSSNNASISPVKVIVLGDKARNQIARDFSSSIAMNVSNVGRQIPTFEDAAGIAKTISKHFPLASYPRKSIIYNRFVSVLAFEPVVLPIPTPEDLTQGENWTKFEASAGEMDNYAEFLFASLLFKGLVEGHAAEMAAKRASMDNATKNARGIIERLTMQFNQTRQAVITNELVDIITGASAL